MAEHEVVVGFHPDDDLEVPPKNTRWVTAFSHLFKNRLRMVCPKPEPKIWSFGDVAGYEKVEDATSEAFKEARIFIAILSRIYGGPDAYYKAHWEHLEQAIGPEDFATRLFRVYKLRPDPQPANDVTGYVFWREDRRPIELTPDSEDFALKLNELAYDVADVLKKLRSLPPPQSVFLASAPPSMTKKREQIRTWLRAQKLRLLPEGVMHRPSDREEYSELIDKMLERCALSIHILAPDDGEGLPELDGQSAVAIEYYRARRRIDAGQMAGIGWSPPGVAAREKASGVGVQRDLIDRPAHSFDDFVGESLAALYEQILLRLRQPVDPTTKERRRVYVVSHPADAAQIRSLVNDLEKDHYLVESTTAAVESAGWRSEYSDKINKSHAAIMCGGNAPSNFLAYVQQTALEHVQKNVNLSLDRIALYAGPDPNLEKELFIRWAPFKTKLVDYSGFRKTTVEPFLKSVFTSGSV